MVPVKNGKCERVEPDAGYILEADPVFGTVFTCLVRVPIKLVIRFGEAGRKADIRLSFFWSAVKIIVRRGI